jgi:phospholipase C
MGIIDGGLERVARIGLVTIGLWLCTGCASVVGGSFPGGGSDVGVAVPLKKTINRYVSHVVIIIQENRSFENFFAGYPGANAPMSGCGRPQDGKAVRVEIRRISSSSCPPGDDTIPLHQETFAREPNATHLFQAAIIDWDHGKMDGFSKWGGKGTYPVYAYIERSQVATYWSIAHQYVLADAMFPTEFGPSWTAHLTLVAGTDDVSSTTALANFADTHSNCKAAPGTRTTIVNEKRVLSEGGPFPCLTQFNTMAEALDVAGISWKYYVAQPLKEFIWSPFAAISYVYNGSDWTNNIIAPQTQILTDIAQKKLASVSWVTPSHNDSDHPGAHSDTGPSWVASVINAVGESPYWNSTAIVVLWDDWGGFYDNAPPPQLDLRGLGIRVPCLIISPYAKQGYVSHTQYEFGSVLKLIEETFPVVPPLGSPSQGYTDSRGHSLRDAFDFSQAPRAFVPIRTKYPASYFLHEPRSMEPPDNE